MQLHLNLKFRLILLLFYFTMAMAMGDIILQSDLKIYYENLPFKIKKFILVEK